MSERVIPEKIKSKEDCLMYLRHIFVYEFAKKNLSKNDYILDLGCGEGYGTNLLSRHVMKIVGLDVDKNTVMNASNKYGSENCNFDAYNGIKIPYSDNTFDAIVSFQVIEHVQNDKSFVSEIYRVLKMNGIFILTTPNRVYRLRPGQKPWQTYHVREYYSYELEQILKGTFSNVKVYGICGIEDVQKFEIERVRRVSNMASLDIFKFRRILPDSIKYIIGNIINRTIKQRVKNNNILNGRDPKDYYYIVDDNIDESLDLLGFCKK